MILFTAALLIFIGFSYQDLKFLQILLKLGSCFYSDFVWEIGIFSLKRFDFKYSIGLFLIFYDTLIRFEM